MQTLRINKELQTLIPPLKEDELLQLEKSIIEDGCRDPIVTWDGTIIDGHNRYSICEKHGIEFNTVEKEFDDIEAVKEWMLENQLGKRNAHPNLLSYIRGMMYLSDKGRGQNVPGRTREILAEKTNVSDKTIQRDAKFAQAVNLLSDYRNEILTGETHLKKQEISEIFDFYQIEDKPYEVELHILYNNPDEIKKHTAIFKKIDALVKKYEKYKLHKLVKTEKRKEEDGREFIFYDVADVEINIKEKIIELLDDNDMQDIESILLSHIKGHLNVKPLWKPAISEEEYEKMLEIERQEAILEERKLYTPRVIHGDTLQEITKIESESIDLIVTDPPYNMDKADWDSYGSAEEFADWAEKWLKECFRVLKPHGSIYVFGLNRMLSHIQMRMEKIGFIYRNWIIWDTVQGAGGGLWVNRQEAILYFSKTNDTYENKDAIKLYRSEENIREYKGKTYEFKNPSNIWRFPVVDNKSEDRTTHPTQKPVELIERMIKANSKEDDTVLDCFIGSGTTGVAAMKNRRRSIGFEMEKEYISISKDRFEKVEI